LEGKLTTLLLIYHISKLPLFSRSAEFVPLMESMLSTEKTTEDLPEPDPCRATDVVIYDGECRFCRGGVEQLRRIDVGGKRLSFLSLHDPRIVKWYPDLTHDELMRQMYIVDTSGKRHAGADAVRFLSRRLPLLWALAPLLHVPGTASLWRFLYDQVAERRYRIAGRICTEGTCQLHQRSGK
jgi:predicted DCC family thiol-disulfide oxidoreductase YuxK